MKIRNLVSSLVMAFAAFIGLQARAADAPVISEPLTAATTIGASFSYQVVASNSPSSYFASPLPTGLTIDRNTGIISGSPSFAGKYSLVVGATNSSGTGIATLTLNVDSADLPVVTNDPLYASGIIGRNFSFILTGSDSDVSFSANPTNLPPGLALGNTTGSISGFPSSPGTYLVPITVSNALGSNTVTLTIVIAPAGGTLPVYLPPPVITSAATASAQGGSPFSYAITATNSPTSFSATGLPAGLTVNTSTGVISGSPQDGGTYAIVLTATNATATTARTITLAITPPPIVAPVVTGPSTASGTATAAFTSVQVATTSGTPTSYSASGLPPGLSINTSTGVISGTPTTAGTYNATITATNTAGSGSRQLTFTIAPAPLPPSITSGTTIAAAVGTAIPAYTITATGTPNLFGASGLPPGLTININTGVITGTPTTPGTYVVTIGATNAVGTTTTALTITVAGSRIVNFSARALAGPGDQTLVMGFAVAGNGKNVLIRGIGPALTSLGVANAVADPMLTVFSGSNTIASNDDWQVTTAGQATAADIAATATRVGAFALPNGSKDAALITVLNNGPYTTSMVRANATTGVALTEVYDLDTTGNSRLSNVSARINVSPGEGTLIAGIVISGNGPKTVLVRGIGPSLTQFGVTGVLADPQITVLNGSTVIATNDNWEVGSSSAAQISTASTQVGAFALVPGSKDAAMLATLQPGSYTVQITGVGNTSGVALIEIYDTQ